MAKPSTSNLPCWVLAAVFFAAIPFCLLEPAADTAIRLPPLTLAVLVASPLVVALTMYRTLSSQLEQEQRQVRQMSELHISTVEALARAIDAKDQQSHLHLRRIQVFASELARAAGLSEIEAHGVRTAALLHDVGQLAVPEHILAKPGPLTHEEREKVRTHPEFGAAILADVPFPYPVAPFILSHHERWDGRGYPAGLKGEEIPLGARILSVVDYFDALTSERPYHRAMQTEAAVRLLEQEAGRALDPRLVSKFLGLLPRLLVETAHLGAPPTSALLEDGGRSVFDEIALAHRELYTLYEIAHSMGTSLSLTETMDLVASKLARLVPFSCCALFLFDGEGPSLVCRFARGVDADVVDRLLAGDGGAAGLVARSRRSLVNVPPREDLDKAGASEVETRLRSSLLVPLVFHDRAIGTLAVYDSEPERYTENHRRLLLRVAEQAAAVIHNSVLYEQTRQDSLTDALTGLPNVRFLYMHVAREMARATRLGSKMALIVLDVDDFKKINDRCGHRAGDLALREIGHLLREAIRPYDLCARYAGDEFILVLSNCDGNEAVAKLEELQAAIERLPVPDPSLQLGISGGIASFPDEGRSYESLLALADSRMYRNKGARKGALRVPEPLVAAAGASFVASLATAPEGIEIRAGAA
ncbi:MAG: HD domain-containing phosphohydrolase [Vicinamibacterales bacterium]